MYTFEQERFTESASVAAIRRAAHTLQRAPADFAPLLRRIGDARIVMLGESSHGTHEFYQVRAELTRWLIEEKGFDLVAVEADWPDAYRVNRWVRGKSGDADAQEALRGFQRFPAWMWRNSDMLDFVGWLRDYNDALPAQARRVGFYGLDLYALYTSIQVVLNYLQQVDPDLARQAREGYACFDHFASDAQSYGYSTVLGLTPSCEREALQQLVALRRAAGELAQRDGRIPEDEFFFIEQNARLIVNAEAYYRSMFAGRGLSWNLRDKHMLETLDALLTHFSVRDKPARAVVWAHNSHIGDARATEGGATGQLNVGQLVRERHARDAVLIGLTTYDGSVTAASDWDRPAERKMVRPALAGSYEALFHEANIDRFLLVFDDPALRVLEPPRLERAIGVIYRPDSERASHYFHAHMRSQFDALIHYDNTRALEPIERTALWEKGEAPETFPSGL
jgi:erythromycin esterase-like protein